jgi:hypothetical protein
MEVGWLKQRKRCWPPDDRGYGGGLFLLSAIGRATVVRGLEMGSTVERKVGFIGSF